MKCCCCVFSLVSCTVRGFPPVCGPWHGGSPVAAQKHWVTQRPPCVNTKRVSVCGPAAPLWSVFVWLDWVPFYQRRPTTEPGDNVISRLRLLSFCLSGCLSGCVCWHRHRIPISSRAPPSFLLLTAVVIALSSLSPVSLSVFCLME